LTARAEPQGCVVRGGAHRQRPRPCKRRGQSLEAAARLPRLSAAAKRVTAALGVGRLGPDAPLLKPLPGGPVLASRPGTLAGEIAWIGAEYGYGELWGREGVRLFDLTESACTSHPSHGSLPNEPRWY
jgi:hypothetical protein